MPITVLSYVDHPTNPSAKILIEDLDTELYLRSFITTKSDASKKACAEWGKRVLEADQARLATLIKHYGIIRAEAAVVGGLTSVVKFAADWVNDNYPDLSGDDAVIKQATVLIACTKSIYRMLIEHENCAG